MPHSQAVVGKHSQWRVKIIRQFDARHGAESGTNRRMRLLRVGCVGLQEKKGYTPPTIPMICVISLMA